MSTAGLFFYHVRSPQIDAHLRRLKHQTQGLVEWRSAYNPGNHARPQVDFEYHHASQLMPQRYRQLLSNGGVQNGLMDAAILPCVLALQADYVWVMEYDVDFAGDWKHLFRQFDDNPADLLTSTLLPYDACPSWSHWKFARMPDQVSPDQGIRGFHPIMRISRKFAEGYVACMESGQWGGHYEFTMPTIGVSQGYVVEDIGGDGPFCPASRRGKNYQNTPSNNDLGPGTLLWRPSRETYFQDDPAAFDEENLIYHPVKNGLPNWKKRRWHIWSRLAWQIRERYQTSFMATPPKSNAA